MLAIFSLLYRRTPSGGSKRCRGDLMASVVQKKKEGRGALFSHSRQLVSHRRGNFLQLVAHSALGLVDVYNLLPEYIVMATTVRMFQRRLQELVKVAVQEEVQDWANLFSPRKALFNHELRRWRRWEGTRNIRTVLPVTETGPVLTAIAGVTNWLAFGQGLMTT